MYSDDTLAQIFNALTAGEEISVNQFMVFIRRTEAERDKNPTAFWQACKALMKALPAEYRADMAFTMAAWYRGKLIGEVDEAWTLILDNVDQIPDTVRRHELIMKTASACPYGSDIQKRAYRVALDNIPDIEDLEERFETYKTTINTMGGYHSTYGPDALETVLNTFDEIDDTQLSLDVAMFVACSSPSKGELEIRAIDIAVSNVRKLEKPYARAHGATLIFQRSVDDRALGIILDAIEEMSGHSREVELLMLKRMVPDTHPFYSKIVGKLPSVGMSPQAFIKKINAL